MTPCGIPEGLRQGRHPSWGEEGTAGRVAHIRLPVDLAGFTVFGVCQCHTPQYVVVHGLTPGSRRISFAIAVHAWRRVAAAGADEGADSPPVSEATGKASGPP